MQRLLLSLYEIICDLVYQPPVRTYRSLDRDSFRFYISHVITIFIYQTATSQSLLGVEKCYFITYLISSDFICTDYTLKRPSSTCMACDQSEEHDLFCSEWSQVSSVCLSACLSDCITRKPHDQI